MSAHSTAADRSENKQPSFGVGSFLFALVFALLVYLLVLSMARHHFFTGGHPNRPAASSPADN